MNGDIGEVPVVAITAEVGVGARGEVGIEMLIKTKRNPEIKGEAKLLNRRRRKSIPVMMTRKLK